MAAGAWLALDDPMPAPHGVSRNGTTQGRGLATRRRPGHLRRPSTRRCPGLPGGRDVGRRTAIQPG